MKKLDRPEKIKTPIEEAEVLLLLKESVEWAIFKRACERYIDNLRKVAFKLRENDPDMPVRHAELTGQALGIRSAIKLVEDMGKKK